MKTVLLIIVFIAFADGASATPDSELDDSKFPGEQSDFHSFIRYDYQFNSKKCIIVAPKTAAAGNPWIWRARFFGHEPQLDVALLKRGYHVAYIDVAGMFGSPDAVEIWNDFYGHVTSSYQFHPKPVLEGMSRGGLIIFNWAKANPEKVCCIYGDAPVCDIKSWPGAQGDGNGNANEWKRCLEAYGLTLKQALDPQSDTSRCNPIDGLEPLANANVPILCVVGDADFVVPVAENTAILQDRYRKLGGKIKVIHKLGIGHHPHSLKDPAPIVDFILQSARDN